MIFSADFLMNITEKIDPVMLTNYLAETGWNIYPSKRTDLKVFQYVDGEKFYQVTVPLDKNLGDYKQAMYRAVETVASKENRAIEQLIGQLLDPDSKRVLKELITRIIW